MEPWIYIHPYNFSRSFLIFEKRKDVNYERKLNDQPQVDYSDIYSFYDKKKEEYIKQNGDPYGIFTNDPTIKNRENVIAFLKMPDDYDELAGDKDDN